MTIGCVRPRPEAKMMTVKGRDVKTGLAQDGDGRFLGDAGRAAPPGPDDCR